MKRLLLFAALVAAALAGPADAQAPPRPEVPPVDVLKVEGTIDPTLSAYVREEVRAAKFEGALVILQLDSRGAYGDEAIRLGEFLRDTGIPVVTWVGPAGARVEGGALFVAYSSSLVAMAPGAGIGPARPFDLATNAGREDPAEAERLGDRLQALAAGTGADPAGIRRMVQGESLAAGPALDAGAAEVAAANVPELLAALDGRTVLTSLGPITLDLGAGSGTVRFREPGPVARILHAGATPTAVYVLLVLGLWLIAFETTQPGVGAAGVAGVLGVAFAAYELTVIPVSWPGLVLLLAGVAMQALDVVIRRVATLTVVGTVAFAAGSVLAWWGVGPAIDLAPWLIVLFTAAGALFFGFVLTVALRSRERVRETQLGLVGLVGEVRSDLDPEGGVVVKGAVWRARTMDGPIPKGRRVRVRGVDGLILKVEEEPD